MFFAYGVNVGLKNRCWGPWSSVKWGWGQTASVGGDLCIVTL